MEFSFEYGTVCLSQEVINKTDPRYLVNLHSLLRTLISIDVDSEGIEALLLSPNHTVYARVIGTVFIQKRYRKNYKNRYNYRLVELVLDENNSPRVYIEGKPYLDYYHDKIHSRETEMITRMEEEVRRTPLVRLHNSASKEDIVKAVQRINQTDEYKVMSYSFFSDPVGGSIEIKVLNINDRDSESISDFLHSVVGPSNYLIEFVSYSFHYDAYFWKDYRLTKGGIVVSKYNRSISIETVLNTLKDYSFNNIQIVEDHEEGWKITFETRCLYPAKLYEELCKKGIPVLGVSGNIKRLFGAHSFGGVKLKLVPVSTQEESEESIMWDIMNGYGEYHGY